MILKHIKHFCLLAVFHFYMFSGMCENRSSCVICQNCPSVIWGRYGGHISVNNSLLSLCLLVMEVHSVGLYPSYLLYVQDCWQQGRVHVRTLTHHVPHAKWDGTCPESLHTLTISSTTFSSWRSIIHLTLNKQTLPPQHLFNSHKPLFPGASERAFHSNHDSRRSFWCSSDNPTVTPISDGRTVGETQDNPAEGYVKKTSKDLCPV